MCFVPTFTLMWWFVIKKTEFSTVSPSCPIYSRSSIPNITQHPTWPIRPDHPSSRLDPLRIAIKVWPNSSERCILTAERRFSNTHGGLFHPKKTVEHELWKNLRVVKKMFWNLSKFQEVDFCCCSSFSQLLHYHCRAQLLCKQNFPTWQTSVPWKIPRSAKQRCTGSLLAGRAMPSCQGHRRGYSLTGHPPISLEAGSQLQGGMIFINLIMEISTCFLANCWWTCHRWWPEKGLGLR